jgi:hypothetical protein
VQAVLARPGSEIEARRRWEFAATHSWDARADQARAILA